MAGHYRRRNNCQFNPLGLLVCCVCSGCILPWIFLSVGISKTAEHASLTEETCEAQGATVQTCQYSYQDCSSNSNSVWNDDDDDNNCRTRYRTGQENIFSVSTTKCVSPITESGGCHRVLSDSRAAGVYAKSGSFKCFVPDCSYDAAYLTEDEVVSSAVMYFVLTALFASPWICIIVYMFMAISNPARQSDSVQNCLHRVGCHKNYNKNADPQYKGVATTIITTGQQPVIMSQPQMQQYPAQAQPMQQYPPPMAMAQPMVMAQPMMQQYPAQAPMMQQYPAQAPMMQQYPVQAQPMMQYPAQAQPMMGQPMPDVAPPTYQPAYQPQKQF